jgi:hypothetical protein
VGGRRAAYPPPAPGGSDRPSGRGDRRPASPPCWTDPSRGASSRWPPSCWPPSRGETPRWPPSGRPPSCCPPPPRGSACSPRRGSDVGPCRASRSWFVDPPCRPRPAASSPSARVRPSAAGDGPASSLSSGTALGPGCRITPAGRRSPSWACRTSSMNRRVPPAASTPPVPSTTASRMMRRSDWSRTSGRTGRARPKASRDAAPSAALASLRRSSNSEARKVRATPGRGARATAAMTRSLNADTSGSD